MWLAEAKNGEQVAVKVLRRGGDRRRARFEREVDIQKSLYGVDGVLPILDSFPPGSAGPPWFAMPVAEADASKTEADLLTGAKIACEIAHTLGRVHARGVAHRDMKPSNILRVNGRWYLSDFGVAKASSDARLTLDGESVGAKWTIAPEMRREAYRASGEAADVYSLAKVLWMLASGQPRGFDGGYDRDSPQQSLRQWNAQASIGSLEDLLADSTNYDPAARPTAVEFAERLATWIKGQNKFHLQSRLEWASLQRYLFPRHTPARAVWTDMSAIVEVLDEVGRRHALNHVFLPGGGGHDLLGATERPELKCLDLHLGTRDITSLVRPRSLELFIFAADPEWSYLWLEAAEMESCGASEESMLRDGYEEYVALPGGKALPRVHWDTQEFTENGRSLPLPDGATLTCRYLRGSFVIVAKSSPYNQTPGTYDGRHVKMGSPAFYAYMQRQFARALERRLK